MARLLKGSNATNALEEPCSGRTFILDYAYAGQSKKVKEQIVDMALNGSGIRDTARVLQISTSTVIKELKKKQLQLQQVNLLALKQLNSESVVVDISLAKLDTSEMGGESELDEMWSFVGKKANQRWLWHALPRQSGKILAYVFGNRSDEVFLELKALLLPFGISRFYTDEWGAYKRHLDALKHGIGKQNTQKIENKHLNLRTRIKRLTRRTICFSKTVFMHDLVIGLFINRYEFGLSI